MDNVIGISNTIKVDAGQRQAGHAIKNECWSMLQEHIELLWSSDFSNIRLIEQILDIMSLIWRTRMGELDIIIKLLCMIRDNRQFVNFPGSNVWRIGALANITTTK